jgi:hypothetical protein
MKDGIIVPGGTKCINIWLWIRDKGSLLYPALMDANCDKHSRRIQGCEIHPSPKKGLITEGPTVSERIDASLVIDAGA